jgi:hypothetical protein
MRIALGLLVVLIMAAPAQAAPAKVTWPSQPSYKPGDTVAVTVKADRKVKVAVLRVARSGRVMSAVKRRTLKAGTVRAKLTKTGTYAVRVGRRERTLTVVPAAPAPAPPIQDGTVPVPCAPATIPTVEPILSTTIVRAGETVTYQILNTSDGCIGYGPPYQLELKQPDGTWARPPFNQAFILPMYALPKATAATKRLSIPADAPLGTYRLIEPMASVFPEFDVVAP